MKKFLYICFVILYISAPLLFGANYGTEGRKQMKRYGTAGPILNVGECFEKEINGRKIKTLCVQAEAESTKGLMQFIDGPRVNNICDFVIYWNKTDDPQKFEYIGTSRCYEAWEALDKVCAIKGCKPEEIIKGKVIFR